VYIFSKNPSPPPALLKIIFTPETLFTELGKINYFKGGDEFWSKSIKKNEKLACYDPFFHSFAEFNFSQ